MGVNLGEFDEENEFCTVKITLVENRKAVKTNISLIKRIKVAFEWTVEYYALLMLGAFAALLSSFLLLLIISLLGRLYNNLIN